MSALDILPPSAPGSAPQKRGLFSKFFGHKETAPPMPPPSPREEMASFERASLEDESFDLEEIKRKIGVEEPTKGPDLQFTAPTSTAPTTMPTPPTPTATAAVTLTPRAEERPGVQPVKLEERFSIDDELPDLPRSAKSPFEEEWTSTNVPTQKETDETGSWSASPDKEIAQEWTGATEEAHAEASRGQEQGDWTAEPPAVPETTTLQQPTTFDDTPAIEETRVEEHPLLKEAPAVASAITVTHLDGLAQEHEQLEQEIATLLKETQPTLPPAEHPLALPAPEGQEFLLKNGQPLRSIRELLETLEVIDAETFFHHVNVERNDFANWLRHVFNERQLADELAAATSRKELIKILQAHGKKVDKKFLEEEKRLDAENKTRAKKLERAVKLHGKLAELKVDLAQRATALAEDKALFTDTVHRRITSEVEQRMKRELATTHHARKEGEQMKREYERRMKAVSAALDRRETRIAEKEESLRRSEQMLAEDRKQFEAQRKQAQPLLEQATDVEAQLQANVAERARLEEERKRLFEEREKVTADRRAIGLREANIGRREAAVQKERSELIEREAGIAKKAAALQAEQKAFAESKVYLEKQEKVMKEEERKALARLKDEERLAEEKEKKATQAEHKLQEQLRERRKVTKYIEEAEQKIAQHEERLSGEGMHHYLGGKLKAMGAAKESAPAVENVRNMKIYAMVDKAREALQHGETAQARELYAKVREAFNHGKFSAQEKSVLYTSIRELYDDLQLAGMKST